MFLDREIRVIGEENVPLLDVFNALGRLTKEGKIDTKDRRKIEKVFKLNGYNSAFKKEYLISEKYSNHYKSRKYNMMTCVRYDYLLEMENVLKTYFEKGVISCRYRDELCFIKNLKHYFSCNKDIKISEQTICNRYKIDVTIGSMLCVEYDEPEHIYRKVQDFNRMKEIALFMYFQKEGYFYDYNDVSQIPDPTTINYKNFTYYDFNSVQFLRIRDTNDFSWIPLVYKIYENNINILYQDFVCHYKDSLKNSNTYKLVA